MSEPEGGGWGRNSGEPSEQIQKRPAPQNQNRNRMTETIKRKQELSRTE